MAIKIEAAGGAVGKNLEFFLKLGKGADPSTNPYNLALDLTNKGATLEVHFSKVLVKWESATHGEMVFASSTLPANTTAIMSGHIGTYTLDNAAKMVRTFLMTMLSKIEMYAPKATVETLSPIFSGAKIPTADPALTAKAEAKPSKVILDKMVPLGTAEYLGQAVAGTSSGVVYRCIGLGERIKMGARLTSGTLVVRVEGPLNNVEKAALDELGFDGKAGKNGKPYWSSHFILNGVPVERVIGVMFFNPGLKLTQRAESLKDAYVK